MIKPKKERYMSEHDYADYVRWRKCQNLKGIIAWLKEEHRYDYYAPRWSIRSRETCEEILRSYKYKEKIKDDSDTMFFIV